MHHIREMRHLNNMQSSSGPSLSVTQRRERERLREGPLEKFCSGIFYFSIDLTIVCETVPYLFVRGLKHYCLIYKNTKEA